MFLKEKTGKRLFSLFLVSSPVRWDKKTRLPRMYNFNVGCLLTEGEDLWRLQTQKKYRPSVKVSAAGLTLHVSARMHDHWKKTKKRCGLATIKLGCVDSKVGTWGYVCPPLRQIGSGKRAHHGTAACLRTPDVLCGAWLSPGGNVSAVVADTGLTRWIWGKHIKLLRSLTWNNFFRFFF